MNELSFHDNWYITIITHAYSVAFPSHLLGASLSASLTSLLCLWTSKWNVSASNLTFSGEDPLLSWHSTLLTSFFSSVTSRNAFLKIHDNIVMLKVLTSLMCRHGCQFGHQEDVQGMCYGMFHGIDITLLQHSRSDVSQNPPQTIA